jgi:hypothetical protein
LGKLLFQNLAVDKHAMDPLAPCQRSIPCQDDSTLRTRQGGDLVVICMAGIEGIKAQQAQPLGQTPQHGIRQK